MHRNATDQKTKLPLDTTVTPNEGTEGGAIPSHEFAMTGFRGDTSADSLPSHPGIAPWDALWARSHETLH